MLLGSVDPTLVSCVKRTIVLEVSRSEKKAAEKMVAHLVHEILAPSPRVAP